MNKIDPKKLIEDIKEKFPDKEALVNIVNAFIEKLKGPDKKKKAPAKKKKKKKKGWFSAKYILYFFCLAISLLGIAYFIYGIYEYAISSFAESDSQNYRIISNFDYGKTYLIKELKERKIRRKNLRALNRKLNGEDDLGRMSKKSPCSEDIWAFGEEPEAGNIVIKKPNPYEFEITAYDCKLNPIIGSGISLKKPDKATLELMRQKRIEKKKAKKAKEEEFKRRREEALKKLHANEDENTEESKNEGEDLKSGEHESPEKHEVKESEAKGETQPEDATEHKSAKKESHEAQPKHSELKAEKQPEKTTEHKPAKKESHEAQPKHSEVKVPESQKGE